MAMVTAASAESSRAALILDVDGVLSTFHPEPADEVVYPRGYRQHPYISWQSYNPAHGTWLNRVHRQSADIYWISDLADGCHKFMGHYLKVPEFDWIDTEVYEAKERRVGARRALAITALFGQRPLVWADDAIGVSEQTWAQERRESGAPTLLVSPDRHLGLRPGHMRQIDKWLTEFGSPETAT